MIDWHPNWLDWPARKDFLLALSSLIAATTTILAVEPQSHQPDSPTAKSSLARNANTEANLIHPDQPIAAANGASTSAQANAVTRGRAALLGRSYISALYPSNAYDRIWQVWARKAAEPVLKHDPLTNQADTKQADTIPAHTSQVDTNRAETNRAVPDTKLARPADFEQQFRQRYGFSPAPYENDGLPMGLRFVDRHNRQGIASDCLLCHGGSILGKSYIGLPNTTLDLKLFGEEMNEASGRFGIPSPVVATRNRGLTNAAAFGVFLVALRNEDFSLRYWPKPLGWADLPDLDPPAWWLLKYKENMYCDAGMSAHSTRSIMQFMLGIDKTEAQMAELEPTWEDIHQYIRSIEPPPYPFPIDTQLANAGKTIFNHHCSECHGTYDTSDPKQIRVDYPNRFIPWEEIGTDRARLTGLLQTAVDHYNRTWYGKKHLAYKRDGYQPPPLVGVWATAPYFHNGAVPTVTDVLDSTNRPKLYWRARHPEEQIFDPDRLGWKVQPLTRDSLPRNLTRAAARQLYDADRFGMGNQGHTFGDALTADERRAVVEYLKTL